MVDDNTSEKGLFLPDGHHLHPACAHSASLCIQRWKWFVCLALPFCFVFQNNHFVFVAYRLSLNVFFFVCAESLKCFPCVHCFSWKMKNNSETKPFRIWRLFCEGQCFLLQSPFVTTMPIGIVGSCVQRAELSQSTWNSIRKQKLGCLGFECDSARCVWKIMKIQSQLLVHNYGYNLIVCAIRWMEDPFQSIASIKTLPTRLLFQTFYWTRAPKREHQRTNHLARSWNPKLEK